MTTASEIYPFLEREGRRRGELTLVWIDLELTGLDPDYDQIVEIAVHITDYDLKWKREGPSLVIRTDPARLSGWSHGTFAENGLLQDMQSEAAVSEAYAEETVMQFICRWIEYPEKANLAGSSVYVDRMFLRRRMPRIDRYLNYAIIDVSVCLRLGSAWFPDLMRKLPRDMEQADAEISAPDPARARSPGGHHFHSPAMSPTSPVFVPSGLVPPPPPLPYLPSPFLPSAMAPVFVPSAPVPPAFVPSGSSSPCSPPQYLSVASEPPSRERVHVGSRERIFGEREISEGSDQSMHGMPNAVTPMLVLSHPRKLQHRANWDIKRSIQLLGWVRENLFVAGRTIAPRPSPPRPSPPKVRPRRRRR